MTDKQLKSLEKVERVRMTKLGRLIDAQERGRTGAAINKPSARPAQAAAPARTSVRPERAKVL